MTKTISHDDSESIKELLVGKSIVSVHENLMTLNDGTVIKVKPNDGCWGCPSGNFSFSEGITLVENVITDAKVTHKRSGKDEEIFSLFVYTGELKNKNKKNPKTALFKINGSAGNGWYGTGFTLEVAF